MIVTQKLASEFLPKRSYPSLGVGGAQTGAGKQLPQSTQTIPILQERIGSERGEKISKRRKRKNYQAKKGAKKLEPKKDLERNST